MVDHTLRANWGAYIALSDKEAWWTFGIPLLFTLLAIVALIGLTTASPESKWLFTAILLLFEELWACEIIISLF